MPVLDIRLRSARLPAVACAAALLLAAGIARSGDGLVLHSFKRQRLTDVYFSEGANAGDLNRDGHPDVVYGPYWFEGPGFTAKHELYPPKPQNREGYADNFFNWIYDFNGDGWNDVFVVGFPVNVGVGLVMLGASLPFAFRYLAGRFAALEPALDGLVRGLVHG